jgi:integrase
LTERLARWGPSWRDTVRCARAPTRRRRSARPTQHLKSALERAGLDRAVELYNLRHTHATLLLEGGADVAPISEELRRSTVVLTLNTYVRGGQRSKRKAVDQLDELLSLAVASSPAARGVPN